MRLPFRMLDRAALRLVTVGEEEAIAVSCIYRERYAIYGLAKMVAWIRSRKAKGTPSWTNQPTLVLLPLLVNF